MTVACASRSVRLATIGCGLVLTAGVPAALAADTLGRLFFTPGERARLDARRDTRPGPEMPQRTPLPSLEEPLHYGGYARLGNGPAALWLNGAVLRSDARELADRRLQWQRSGGALRIAPPSGAPPVEVKVGQAVHPSGVVEPYALPRAPAAQHPHPEADGSAPMRTPRRARGEAAADREPGP